MPVSIPIELLEVGLALLVLGLLSGAWLSGRARFATRGFWPMAWAVIVAMGIGRIVGVPPMVELAGTVIFWALQVAGAYRYADLVSPRWLAPGAVAATVVVGGLAGLWSQTVAGWVAVTVVLVAMVQCSAIVHRAARRRNASWLQQLLPLGFVAIAAVGSWDHFVVGHGIDSMGVWLVAGTLIATHQAIAILDEVRRKSDRVASDLEESVSVLRSTLEATGEGILVVDSDGHYTSFNRAFGEMWQIPEEILERRESETALRYAMPQLKDPDQFYSTVKRLYRDREAESFDTLEFKDGRVFERYSRPQRIGDEIVGRVWSFRDVTQRMRAQEEADRYRDHLEDVVEERTRELVGSRDKLRQADRLVAIGTLAAGVAHQINNPIGAILNASEYALLCGDDEDAREVLENALRVNATEARRCGAIVRGMLQFARQEPVDKEVEDLNQAVRLAIRAVDSYARDRGARVELDLCDSPLHCVMSLLEMEQVVVNLVRNGIESNEDGAFVRVSTRRDGAQARIEVVDNGGGIRPEEREQIFDPFFSTRLAEGGTGLGLSVAHGIVTEHHGRISVVRSDERGTRFAIEVPLATDEPPASDARPSRAETP